MSIWIMHMPMTEAEEDALIGRDVLPLPFEGLPDLSQVTGSHMLRQRIGGLHPEMTPESLGRMQERIWKILGELQPEDIIAVPLQHKRVIMVAEITGKYTYDEQGGKYAHYIAVKWQGKAIPFVRFRLHKNLLNSSGWTLTDVKDQSARAIIQSSLPRKYNRFAGLKWIVIVFTLWHLFQMFVQH